MIYYLDTSVIVAWLTPEQSSKNINIFLSSIPFGTVVISPWVRTELASVLARKVRMKEMHGNEIHRVFDLLDQLIRSGMIGMVDVVNNDFEQSAWWIMVAPVPLRGPDALHLAVTNRIHATLISLDAKLLVAAQWARVRVGVIS